jgi:hypothetical protein
MESCLHQKRQDKEIVSILNAVTKEEDQKEQQPPSVTEKSIADKEDKWV